PGNFHECHRASRDKDNGVHRPRLGRSSDRPGDENNAAPVDRAGPDRREKGQDPRSKSAPATALRSQATPRTKLPAANIAAANHLRVYRGPCQLATYSLLASAS